MADATKTQANKEHGKAGQSATAAPNGTVQTIKRVRKAPLVPADETPSARFIRLARKRVNACVRKMDQVTALFRGTGYEWTPEQAEKVAVAIADAVTRLQTAMTAKADKKADAFTL